ncbi:ABC transporter ATP-binding protein [Paenibacillus sp. MBLB2552]|uniref:ABC transporter ATP-binding protein n=1 Tax=Paenibacillus mellifer TaxID=2937794 RepID=A0A9X2BPP3_9BACL|nr:ABC transporter ATP-binding protein [Paenibacillus mellifer]MCK8487082.1 ABC transporter ATP-binding protein [Paenibacillus mellifer]
MEEIIRTEHLTKRYGSRTVVNEVSMTVKRGEIYGFLGLNGAGKTTTIRCLLGMNKPTSGEVYLFGRKLTQGGEAFWKRVGYLVETPAAYPTFTVRENLKLFAGLRGIRERSAVEAVMEQLNMSEYADTQAKHLSLGNAQKLGLAKALLHHPEILILDEPTNALDPAGIVEVRELLRNLAERHGVTVFISSHILEEISKIATRIGIIHRGVLLQELSADEFEQLRQKRLYIGVNDQTEAARTVLRSGGYHVRVTDNGELEVSDEHAIRQPENVAKLLTDARLPLALLKVEEEDLEDYFLKTIGAKGGTEE